MLGMPKVGRDRRLHPHRMTTRRQAKILQRAATKEVKPFPFLELPSEIRNEIYQLVLPSTGQLYALFFHTRAFRFVVKSPEDLHSTVKFLHDLNNVFPGHLRIFKADILDHLFVTFSTLSRVPSKLTHIPVQAAEDERAEYPNLTYLNDYKIIEWGLNTLMEQVQQLTRDQGFDLGYVARFFRLIFRDSAWQGMGDNLQMLRSLYPQHRGYLL